MERERYGDSRVVVGEICWRLGAAEATLRRGQRHLGALDVTEIRRLRRLEGEDRRLTQLVALRAAQQVWSLTERLE
jgi:hypothetical protein